MSQTGPYSQVAGLWETLTEPQGSTASAIVRDGLQRAAFFQQQPKGSCNFLFENHSSWFSPHLEDVGSSWHWIFDAVDGEENTGLGIDHKT